MSSSIKIRSILTLAIVAFWVFTVKADKAKVCNNQGEDCIRQTSISPSEIKDEENELRIHGEDKPVKFGKDHLVTVKSESKIVFKPGTKISAGSEVHAFISDAPVKQKEKSLSFQQQLDIVKKLKATNKGKRKKSPKQDDAPIENHQDYLFFLLTIYDNLSKKTSKAHDISGSEPQGKKFFNHNNQNQAVTTEQTSRTGLPVFVALHDSPFYNPLKISYCHEFTDFKPKVNMVLRL